MRPSTLLFSLLCVVLVLNTFFWAASWQKKRELKAGLPSQQLLVARLGLTDLALSTEARYTRHPSVTDPLAPFMDHPGNIEHFPSGSIIVPDSRGSR